MTQDGDSLNMLMRGCLTEQTHLEFSIVGKDGTQHTIASKDAGILKPNFKFEEMGIGGLDNEFADIFRRAFASRIYPPELLKQLGISHVKGLYAVLWLSNTNRFNPLRTAWYR